MKWRKSAGEEKEQTTPGWGVFGTTVKLGDHRAVLLNPADL